MLRAVVGTFLDAISEREFDGPLLALLAAQGFTDVHFIHGGFEFGKDVIAKRTDPDSGETRQYSIQSKAGDIGLGDWRLIRPQLEECEYNTRSHPAFDDDLPRVAVLVTTGRLKGGAGIDSQEFRKACKSRGLADFEVWEHSNLLDWLCIDPSLGLTGIGVQDDLIGVLGSIGRYEVTEPALEKHTRRWLLGDREQQQIARASIEASLICHELVKSKRLDLAALVALHLYRATWQPVTGGPTVPSAAANAALRLFIHCATNLLEQVEPLLDDVAEFAHPFTDLGAVITYPAACCRLAEIFGLLAMLGDNSVRDRSTNAVLMLTSKHPGTSRPPSDLFAASLVPITAVLARFDKPATKEYLRSVSNWILDRHDPAKDGLGLGSLDEDERMQFERLVAGSTTMTRLEPRSPSYLATVVLDMLWVIGSKALYEAVRENLAALRVVPSATAATEDLARWRRGGANVFPQPRIEQASWDDRSHDSAQSAPSTQLDAVILGSVCRSRHYTWAVAELIGPVNTDI